MDYLKKTDPQTYVVLQKEEQRQAETITLIPSENYASKAVLRALGSVFTNKYAEGEPSKRYYQGNKFIDEIEVLGNERALKLFKLNPTDWHVNMKGISAGVLNFSVLTALLEPHSGVRKGSKIMSMYLPDGGHLSHGWHIKGKPINFSAKVFEVTHYRVHEKTKQFDYAHIEEEAQKVKPNIIISGGTAYPREIDYERIGKIAKSTGAYYFADIAHEAGLVAAEVLNSPFPHADVVTMSTQKTLRGPRGAIVFCKKELAERIDRAIFPGLQGGPFINNIAAITVALKEASSSEFKRYAKQTLNNARILAKELTRFNFDLVSGGTDKHLILIDLRNKNMNGKEAALALEAAGIVANKNTVPYDTGTPFTPSGLRIGTPAVTTRGMKEKEMKHIAKWIHEVLDEKRDVQAVAKEIKILCKRFPVPGINA